MCLKTGLARVSGHREAAVTGFDRVDLSHDQQAHPADFTVVIWKQTELELEPN